MDSVTKELKNDVKHLKFDSAKPIQTPGTFETKNINYTPIHNKNKGDVVTITNDKANRQTGGTMRITGRGTIPTIKNEYKQIEKSAEFLVDSTPLYDDIPLFNIETERIMNLDPIKPNFSPNDCKITNSDKIGIYNIQENILLSTHRGFRKDPYTPNEQNYWAIQYKNLIDSCNKKINESFIKNNSDQIIFDEFQKQSFRPKYGWQSGSVKTDENGFVYNTRQQIDNIPGKNIRMGIGRNSRRGWVSGWESKEIGRVMFQ